MDMSSVLPCPDPKIPRRAINFNYHYSNTDEDEEGQLYSTVGILLEMKRILYFEIVLKHILRNALKHCSLKFHMKRFDKRNVQNSKCTLNTLLIQTHRLMVEQS